MDSEWDWPFSPRFCLKQKKHSQDLTIAIDRSGSTKMTAMGHKGAGSQHKKG